MRKIVGYAFMACLVSFSLSAAESASAIARAHSDKFARAFNAHDAKGMVALYADDARVVWPGAGEEGKGKSDVTRRIDAMVANSPDATLRLVSQDAVPLGSDYIATVSHWEMTVKGPDGKAMALPIRATEVLRVRGGDALYVIDHASIGMAPAPANP
jgi:uncharacterized protein (TIGR02246 family)